MSVKCRICFDDAAPPVATRCGHTFCRGHIEEWFKTEISCPVCRRVVSKNSLITLFLGESKDGDGSGSSQDGHGGRRGDEGGFSNTGSDRGAFSVASVLKNLHKEWDRTLVDRARLASPVGQLESENTLLKEQLSKAREELSRTRASSTLVHSHHKMFGREGAVFDHASVASKTSSDRATPPLARAAHRTRSGSSTSQSSNDNSANEDNNSDPEVISSGVRGASKMGDPLMGYSRRRAVST